MKGGNMLDNGGNNDEDDSDEGSDNDIIF